MGAYFTMQGRVVPTHFVVACKRCRRYIPIGPAVTWKDRQPHPPFPTDNTVVLCPLCFELRRYRPSEVFLGFPDSHLAVQQDNFTRHRRRNREIKFKLKP